MAEPASGQETREKTPCIQASGLCKTFSSTGGGIEVLAELDLALDEGDSVAVVGASGIGKSTLLHILGTLDRPDGGRLFIQGRDVLSLPDDKLCGFRNNNVGFVFQFHHLLPEFSALENTSIPALIQGKDQSQAREMATRVLERVGLSARLHHRVGEMSGGEQQRVAVARALVLSPAVFLADEPTGNLDARTGGKIHRLLVELNAELNMTMVVVTHNMELAGMMNRQVTLEDGRLREVA